MLIARLIISRCDNRARTEDIDQARTFASVS